MDTEEKKELISELNEEALLLDGYDEAIIGIAMRCGQEAVVAYDEDKIVEILMRDMDYDEAYEFYSFNIAGAYVGPNTPMLIKLFKEEE